MPELDQETPEVLYSVADHVATITLNRPDRMNTISRVMLDSLADYLVAARDDADVRVVVLTGTGRAFCAGLEVTRVSNKGSRGVMDPNAGPRTTIDLRKIPPIILNELDKPTICALNGSAAGYGFDIAMGCDIRIMSDKAKLSAAFTKRGIVPESGGTWLLPRMLGWSKAAELIFTGRTLSAAESLEMGLVSSIHPAEEIAATAETIAAEIASNAPLAVQAAKRMMRAGQNEPFPQHVHHVYLQLNALMRTDDVKEGMQSFVEKRPPVFKGK
jgi:enoyl-CoA hydratase/carnithine racemase